MSFQGIRTEVMVGKILKNSTNIMLELGIHGTVVEVGYKAKAITSVNYGGHKHHIL